MFGDELYSWLFGRVTVVGLVKLVKPPLRLHLFLSPPNTDITRLGDLKRIHAEVCSLSPSQPHTPLPPPSLSPLHRPPGATGPTIPRTRILRRMQLAATYMPYSQHITLAVPYPTLLHCRVYSKLYRGVAEIELDLDLVANSRSAV